VEHLAFLLQFWLQHWKNMNKTKVVAISGASGSGKTTIVKHLAKEFDCPFLLFDDHVDSGTYPTDMKSWFQNGANVCLIKTPKLVKSLQEELSKNTCPYLFIEEPFGKERDAISALIDYVVLLDQPMELCLARIIKRHTFQAENNSLDLITRYLDNYEDYFRDIYIAKVNQVKSNCDLVVNGIGSAKDMAGDISAWLKKQEIHK
jgi:uridine kinase